MKRIILLCAATVLFAMNKDNVLARKIPVHVADLHGEPSWVRNDTIPDTISDKIVITQSMITDESVNATEGEVNPYRLFDESSAAGEPGRNQGGTNFTTKWFPGWHAVYPSSCYVNLGKRYIITGVYLRDGADTGTWEFYTGTPGNWTLQFTDNLGGYMSWNEHLTGTIETQYFRVSRSKGGDVWEAVVYGYPAGDITAPAPVTNLVAASVTSSSVVLNWTAPGNDNNTGTATAYDLRYSSSPINASNFVSATEVTNEPLPGVSGTPQSFEVSGLTPSTTYYFALKTSDEVPNTSAVSNVVSATTSSALPQRIVITDAMIYDETGTRDLSGLVWQCFDEQETATTTPIGTTPTKRWKSGNNPNGYPASMVIDLGREYDISSVYWYEGEPFGDGLKGGKIKVESGTPFNWSLRFEQSMVNDKAWHNKTQTFRTRYIHLSKISTATFMWDNQGPYFADAPLHEIVFYGTPAGNAEVPVSEPPHTPFNFTMDEMIGVNAWWFSEQEGDDQHFSAFGMIRVYQDWSRTASTTLTGEQDFSTTYDELYGLRATQPYEIYPCIQGHHDGSNDKPNFGGNTEDPESYRAGQDEGEDDRGDHQPGLGDIAAAAQRVVPPSPPGHCGPRDMRRRHGRSPPRAGAARHHLQGDPFSPGPHGRNGPFSPLPPVRPSVAPGRPRAAGRRGRP